MSEYDVTVTIPPLEYNICSDECHFYHIKIEEYCGDWETEIYCSNGWMDDEHVCPTSQCPRHKDLQAEMPIANADDGQ